MFLHLLLLADSLLSFSFDLEKELQSKPQNAVYSPFSISTTLGICAVGAQEDTLTQITKALHYTGSREDFTKGFKDLITNVMQKENGYPNLALNMETVLFMQKDFEFLPQFQSTVVKDFFGDLRSIDFSKPSQAVQEMNRWFFQKTGGDLGQLFTDRDINSGTRLVVASTLYLKAFFEKAFDTAHTRMKPFHVTKDKEIQIQTMYQKNTFHYYKADNYQVVELNYLPLDKQFALWIVVPNGAMSTLSQADFNAISDGFINKSIELELPRFKLESAYNLIPVLQKLGIKDAFTDDADFSLISEANDLFISDFRHRALIVVEEAGTLAEAATSATFSIKAVGPTESIQLHVDHPFLFLIVDKKNNLPIFMGQVIEPKASTISQF